MKKNSKIYCCNFCNKTTGSYTGMSCHLKKIHKKTVKGNYTIKGEKKNSEIKKYFIETVFKLRIPISVGEVEILNIGLEGK